MNEHPIGRLNEDQIRQHFIQFDEQDASIRSDDPEEELRRVFSEITPPRQFRLPESIIYPLVEDPELVDLQGSKADLVENAYRDLRIWLQMPYISDRFGVDHKRRRGWRRDFLSRHGEETTRRAMAPWNNNKYRAAILARPGTLIGVVCYYLADGDEIDTALLTRVEHIWKIDEIQHLQTIYTDVPIEQRKKIIESIEDRVARVMEVLVEGAEQKARQQAQQQAVA